MSDFRIKLEEARRALPLKRLMEQNGMSPANGNWKRFPKCPLCEHKDSAGVIEDGGRQYFKCFHSSCPSGTASKNSAWDECKFIEYTSRLHWKEASVQFLKMAGVWKDSESHAPSLMPGKAARKIKLPEGMEEVWSEEMRGEKFTAESAEKKEDDTSPLTPLPERGGEGDQKGSAENQKPDGELDEDLVQQCIEIIRSEAQASVALLQRRLRLGYTRAAEIMAELERRVLVGPANGSEPREILFDLPTNAVSRSSSASAVPSVGVPAATAKSPQAAALGEPIDSGSPDEALTSHVSNEDARSAVPPAARLSADASTSPTGAPPPPVPGEVSPLPASSDSGRVAQSVESQPETEANLAAPDDLEVRSAECGVGNGATDCPECLKGKPTYFVDADDEIASISGKPGVRSVHGGGQEGELIPCLRLNKQATVADFLAGKKKGRSKKRNDTSPLTPLPGRGGEGNQRGGKGGGDGDGEPPEGGAPNGAAAPVPPPVQALRWFYERTELTAADAEALWVKRGLTPETCAVFGLRSSLRGYKDVLLEMQNHFPMAVLVESGLWKQGDKPKDPPVPNAQYYGWGIVGKVAVEEEAGKTPGKKAKREVVWDWTLPILIPYFDSLGQLIYLRPHKGNPKGALSRVFIARPAGVASAGETVDFAVITEGEFKVMALWQGLQGGRETVAIAALPGITMAKPLYGDIEDWLSDVEARQVVIAYDNEEKGDPRYPEAYKEEKWKRYDAQVWARYLAKQLSKEGFEGKVCVLPPEWRDAKGKADWDGALAFLIEDFLKEVEGTEAQRPTDPAAIWNVVATLVRREFLQVLSGAARIGELAQLGFFDSEEERLIQNALERISYVAALPIGGDAEIVVARRLQRVIKRVKNETGRMAKKLRGFLILLAKEYQTVQGRYYILKKLGDKERPAWVEQMMKAADDEDVEVRRACEIALQGVPQFISDFYLKAHYVLKKPNGTRQRLVTIHTVHGTETALLSLPSDAFAQPSKFREWLLNACTVATWRAGERELNDLQADVGRAVAYKDVEEVVIRGEHEASKLRFFQDVTYTPEGREIYPDEYGIIWYPRPDGLVQGYRLGEKDQEGQEFFQRTPRMHPKRPLKVDGVDGDERAQTRALFREVSQNLLETIGDYSGFLALGMMCANGAAQEIYKKYTCFPGLWFHGEQGEGKSSVARWLMGVWGFDLEDGIALPGSSNPGLSIAMQQYGNLPVWFDEYQPNPPKFITDKLKNFFGGETNAKKTFDDDIRKVLATPVVSGVATSNDSQLRARYAHIQVSSKRRTKNHFEWFQERSKDFFFLGRYILKHRKDYAEATMRALKSWMESSKMSGVDERSKIVHGVGYAGFLGMVSLLESHEPRVMSEYHEHARVSCQEAMGQTQEGVNVNQFWRDVVTANGAHAFGDTPAERRTIFIVQPNRKAVAPVSELQLKLGAESSHLGWKSFLLYFKPDHVIQALRKHKRQQGLDVPLDRNDLLSQMRVKPYWVPSKHGIHKQRFGHGESGESCWCINVDLHELGYQAVPDAQFEESLRDPETGNFTMSTEWTDPRCGDLFALIESLQSHKKEEAK